MEKIGADFKLAESRQVGKDISGQRFSGNGKKVLCHSSTGPGGIVRIVVILLAPVVAAEGSKQVHLTKVFICNYG